MWWVPPGEELVSVITGLSRLGPEPFSAAFTSAYLRKTLKNSTRPIKKAIQRDIQALEVHADFLGSRIGMTVDATMGMIGLQQNDRVRILSVVAALFLPPTLIASIYGMNFAHMPELDTPWGYPATLGFMLATSVAIWLFLRWKNWL